MQVVDFLLLLVIAGVFGWLGAVIMGAKRMNFALLIIAGLVGAVVGRYIRNFVELPELYTFQVGSMSFPVVWTILGCVIVVGIVAGLTQRT
jgi:uncharacterized membrane protein YeaQ/YmgE (transglycosylase-associated protein family)